jgi:hypothetical protein
MWGGWPARKRHDQQHRIVGGIETVVGDLDALVDGGKRTHAASIIGRMSKARRLGLVLLLLNLLLVAALVIALVVCPPRLCSSDHDPSGLRQRDHTPLSVPT